MSSMFPPNGALPGPTPNGGPSLQDLLGPPVAGAGAPPVGPDPGMGGPPVGPDPSAPAMGPLPPLPEAPAPEEGGGEGDEAAHSATISDVVKQLTGIMDEEADPEDKTTLAGVIAKLTALKAKEQKEADTAMGIGPKEKHMRRMSR